MTKILAGLIAGVVIVLGASSTACSVSVTADCGGFTDCGGVCANLSDDPENCGGCGVSCGGDECINGACTTTVCVDDGSSCSADDDCCSLFCASDNACGCIANGDDSTFCSADSDCCSGDCDLQSGFCQ